MDDTQKTITHEEDYSSNVDTSRPFRSVKEAVAIFGERLLIGALHSAKPFTAYDDDGDDDNPCKEESPNNKKDDEEGEQNGLFDALKKFEAELEETKMELKLLKERESETEITLATLNAELHESMSKLAEAEAAAVSAKKATAPSSIDKGRKEEERMKKTELMIRMENSPTLAQILCIEENEKYYEGKIKKKKKKKPIVPLVTDFFYKKKGDSSNTLYNPLYASPK